jgi:hypothetical protein
MPPGRSCRQNDEPGLKVQCVFRNTERLKQEAEIYPAELRQFMRLSIVANPDSMLNRNVQNDAAHMLSS